MPLSRAEIQKRYRERKKALLGEQYLNTERIRQKKYYKKVDSLSQSEKQKRNTKTNVRVKKHRLKKKENAERNRINNQAIQEHDQSTSGYNSQDFNNLQIRMRFPMRRNGPKRRLSNALKVANSRLRKVVKQNEVTKKKLKTLQRKLQRLSKKESKAPTTPNSKTNSMMKQLKSNDKKVRKELLFANVVLHEIKEKKQTSENYTRNHQYTAVVGNILKKYRLIGKMAHELKADRNKLSKVIKNGINFSKQRRCRKATKFKSSVVAFLEREDNSRTQPGKKDAVKTSDGKVQTYILTDYMANLHQKYIAEHPENKLSLATFCRMRPKHILLSSCLGRNVCLCTKHQNFSLKLQAVRKSGIDVPQNPETFIKSGESVEKNKLPDEVQFAMWKRVTLENQKKKMKIVSMKMDRDAFHEEYLKEKEKFIDHYNTMTTQYQQTRMVKEKLRHHEIVIHMDFAENYNCKTADEVQSAYWNNTQITLHPRVVYYRDAEGTMQHKSYVAVSDSLSHSTGTVLAILKKFFHEVLELSGCSEISYVHYWTDSPTSQYRNRYIFNAIKTHDDLFGCDATWNFYESGHGKNVCDGLGGTVKRLADEFVRSGKCSIQDAEDFMKWTKQNNMKNVTFFFVSKGECEDMTNTLATVTFPAVKGTLKVHSARKNGVGSFCVRDTSCYCDTCMEGGICNTWREIQVSHPENNKDSQLSNECVSSQPTYRTGDFVAAEYDGNWYPAKVLDTDDDDSGLEYEISFMERKKTFYQWPRREDTIWCSKEDILCQINQPETFGKSKRMYKLQDGDCERIKMFLKE